MSLYCTLLEAESALKSQDDPSSGTEENELIRRIRVVSRRIDQIMTPNRKPYFVPVVASKRLPLTRNWILDHGGTYELAFPLLELTSVTFTWRNSISETLTSKVDLVDDTLMWTSTGNGFIEYYARYGTQGFLTIAGTWGYHREGTDAWVDVDSLNGDITASVTDIVVGDVDGLDVDQLFARFSYGALIQIGDEMMDVVGINASTNTLTVKRGVNGSTAAAHSDGDTVQLWQVEEPVRDVTARQAAMLYQRRGSFSNREMDAFGNNLTEYPPDLLAALRSVLMEYQL